MYSDDAMSWPLPLRLYVPTPPAWERLIKSVEFVPADWLNVPVLNQPRNSPPGAVTRPGPLRL